MARTVRSPDGRTWTIERVSSRSSVGDAKDDAFFWPSLIATVIMVVLIVRLLSVDQGLLTLIVCLLFLIWLLERGLNFARPNIRAHTDGPPAETRTWRTTHRFGLDKIEDRVANEIENGRLEAEPSGTVLIGN
ncbi:MAG TPA: hypothetical protein VHH55_07545 [Gaiellaceae bacterium]|nr:hypothetical protein [Gaiellaceae bacterium]